MRRTIPGRDEPHQQSARISVLAAKSVIKGAKHHQERGTHQDLVEEVLDELLLEGARSEQSMQVGSEELGDKIAARKLIRDLRREVIRIRRTCPQAGR